jgi:SAM-dependent methyltransferase
MVFNKRATSIHIINADRGINIFKKKLFYLSNKINNSFSNQFVDENLFFLNFMDKDLNIHYNMLDFKSSPSRKLSNLFWLNLPWEKIKRELNEINIFDTGCGKGNYSKLFMEYSLNGINSYKGIDVSYSKEWELLASNNGNFSFNKFDGFNVFDEIPDHSNLFITQSAIEHFEFDLEYFNQLKRYILEEKCNTLQIHLFPSKECLKLYQFHGIRQYTPRTISKITKLFNDFSYSVLFSLGGPCCNAIHWNYITKPLFKEKIGDLRDKKTKEYNQKLYNAIEKDMQDVTNNPSFYALVIHSFWKEKIFGQLV